MYREKRKLFRENNVEQYIDPYFWKRQSGMYRIKQKIYAAMTCGAFKLIPSLKLFGSQQNNLWLQYADASYFSWSYVYKVPGRIRRRHSKFKLSTRSKVSNWIENLLISPVVPLAPPKKGERIAVIAQTK